MHEHQVEEIRAREPVRAPAAANASIRNTGPGGLLLLQRRYGNRLVQRLLALARKGEGEAEIEPAVELAITQARGGGRALDSGVQRQMEHAFGSDFSAVRIHTGAEAHSLNRSLNAVAFTTGRDIFFRDSAYDPGSRSGRELLAHELTHVVQQGGGAVQGKLVLGAAGDTYEQEADSVASRVVAGLESGASPVQRQCACGENSSSGEECPECRQKREEVQGREAGAGLALTLQRQDDGGGDGGAPLGPSGDVGSADGELGSGSDCRNKCRQDFKDCIDQATPPWWNPFGHDPLPGTPAYNRCLKAKVDCMRNCPTE
jgi:hypothetical protein